MKKTVKLKLYEDKYREGLLSLLVAFAKEVYNTCEPEIDVDYFVLCHNAGVYMVVNDNDECVGFSSFSVNTYYGMRDAVLSNNYLFIDKEYRRSKAMHLISLQAGVMCLENNVSLEHFYTEGSGSMKFIGRLGGKHTYSAYEYDLLSIAKEVDDLKKTINIKDRV